MALPGIEGHEVVRLPTERIEKIKPALEGMIKPALEYAHGELNFEDLMTMVKLDKVQIWAVFDRASMELRAIATTQVVKYPQFKALRVITLGGANMAIWARALDNMLTKFAKAQGCKRMEAFGRRGLAQRIEELGFTMMYVAYGKEVEE